MRGFQACMRCGSLHLRGIKASEGAVGAGLEFNLGHCRDCGWQGMPIEFTDEASWRAFVAAQAGWQDAPDGISACRQCGSKGLRLEGTAAACPECGWRGEPATFPDEEAWMAFATTRRNARGGGGEAG